MTVLSKTRFDAHNWHCDSATRNRLADSLLRDVAGFHDRTASLTRTSLRQVPQAARSWLRSTKSSPAANSLPSGFSVVAGEKRWAACVVVYVGSGSPGVLSFGYWLLTSAKSRLCGGANLDVSNDKHPFWTSWVH